MSGRYLKEPGVLYYRRLSELLVVGCCVAMVTVRG